MTSSTSGLVISSGVFFEVDSPSVVDTTVLNQGFLILRNSGVASHTIVSAGGDEDLNGGSTQSISAVILAGGGQDLVGGTISSATIFGRQNGAFGTIVDTIVSSGGMQVLSGGGTALRTKVESGGEAFVRHGWVLSGGIADGGLIGVVGGTASHTTVSSGGFEFLSANGVSVSATILGSGQEFVAAGGTASFTTVSSGGTLTVVAGGVSVSATILDGAQEAVSAGGVASATTVSSGGMLGVSSGGSAVFATVSAGGVENVSSGGIVTSTTIASGGVEQSKRVQPISSRRSATAATSSWVPAVPPAGR